MAKYTQTTIIVPEAQADALNAELESRGYGPGTFSTPIIKGGGKNATHRGCSWKMSDNQLQDVTDLLSGKGRDGKVDNAKKVTATISADRFEKVLLREGSSRKESITGKA